MKFTWEEKDLPEIYGLWIVKEFGQTIQFIEKYVYIIGFDSSREKNQGRMTLTNIQDGMVIHFNNEDLLDFLNSENYRPLKLKEKIKILTDNHREF